jgi:hypothetical protein
LVDVNLLLSTMKSTDTRVGEWVNVTGYVEEENRGLRRKEGRGRGDRGNVGALRVQAVMLWSAGSVNLGQYETAVSRRMSTESENRPLR